VHRADGLCLLGLGLDRAGLLYSVPGRTAGLFAAGDPDRAIAQLYFTAPALRFDPRDTGGQQEIVATHFAGLGLLRPADLDKDPPAQPVLHRPPLPARQAPDQPRRHQDRHRHHHPRLRPGPPLTGLVACHRRQSRNPAVGLTICRWTMTIGARVEPKEVR
jgi:hypothetical protein